MPKNHYDENKVTAQSYTNAMFLLT